MDYNGWLKRALIAFKNGQQAKVVFATLGFLGKQLLISLIISSAKFVWSKVTS
jgi:hypothetical protein